MNCNNLGFAIERVIHSQRLPGGNLFSAILDREVMRLADRGGASGLVGLRWANLCAEHIATWRHCAMPIPNATATYSWERAVRLDDMPAIASTAARHGLQNPDFLFFGQSGEGPVIQAADAKFSVETARGKQVSPEVVTRLLDLGHILSDLAGEVDSATTVKEGVFLCPDFTLTHIMLQQRQGIVRATVTPEQVILVPAPAHQFFDSVEGQCLIAPLSKVDALAWAPCEDLMAAVYYFRLGRAAIGAWMDAHKPMLSQGQRFNVDEDAVRVETMQRASRARTAFTLIVEWQAEVQLVRYQRATIEQAASPPYMARQLRELVSARGTFPGKNPPSVHSIRRQLGAWYRRKLFDRIGPIYPPVRDLDAVLRRLARANAELNAELQHEASRVVDESVRHQGFPSPENEPVRTPTSRVKPVVTNGSRI